MIKLGYTIMYVTCVESALLFYQQAFGIKKRFMTPEKDYAELDTGETTLAFAAHHLAETNIDSGYIKASESEKPLGMEIALITHDVQATYTSAIQHGATAIKEPIEKPWGQTVSYIRCPSGILVELCSPLATP